MSSLAIRRRESALRQVRWLRLVRRAPRGPSDSPPHRVHLVNSVNKDSRERNQVHRAQQQILPTPQRLPALQFRPIRERIRMYRFLAGTPPRLSEEISSGSEARSTRNRSRFTITQRITGS